jgi:hypothetical protein
MAKKKAGIFDPWRQEKPDAPPPLEPQAARLVNSDTFDSSVQEPIRFHGKRGGVTVWLVAKENSALSTQQAQTNLLGALTHLLKNPALQPSFKNWGIVAGQQTGTAAGTIISDGTRTIAVQGDYTTALDAITFALRDAARADPKVGEYLTSLGIRPYIV